MWLRLWVFFATYWVTWAALTLSPHSPLFTAGLFIVMVFAYKGIAYNAVHDGCHQSITGKKIPDNVIYWVSLGMLGPDPYLWKTRHNVDHHHYVNVPGLDSQIESGNPVFRFSPHQKWRRMHRYQHWYASLLYGIVTLQWIFLRDLKDLFSKEFRKAHTPVVFALHVARVGLMKAAYLFLMVGVPALFLPYSLPEVVLGFLGFHFLLSWTVTITFAISHVNRSMKFVHHDETGSVPHSHYEHQLLTSMDYHPTNPFVNFLFGGMSAHVAHHMFPSVSSVHLPQLTRIISRTAQAHGLRYHEDSLFSLIQSHFSLLKDIGKSEECGVNYLLNNPPEGKKNAG
jgi:linoleoyl-CoA desaturase